MSRDVEFPNEPYAVDAARAAEVRREIHEAILGAETAEGLLNQALAAISKIVDFDLAVVVRYSPKPWQSARPVHFFSPRAVQETNWPQKWFPVDPAVLTALEHGGAETRCVGNIEQWLDGESTQKLKEDLNIQHIVKSGYKSFFGTSLTS